MQIYASIKGWNLSLLFLWELILVSCGQTASPTAHPSKSPTSYFQQPQIGLGQSKTCSLWFRQMRCWGEDPVHGFNVTVPPGPPLDFGDDFTPKKLISGQRHDCVISTEGAVRCFGKNGEGQLGQGNEDDIPYNGTVDDIDLGSGFIVEDGDAGRMHNCFLSTNRSIKCFGKNSEGELGLGDIDNRGDDEGEMGDNLKTVDLGRQHDFIPIQVAAGNAMSCALSMNSKIKCWGNNQNGDLGLGDTDSRGDNSTEMGDVLEPVDLGDFVPIRVIAMRGGCAISANGTSKCWGLNDYGQLGMGHALNIGVASAEMGDDLPVMDWGSDFNVTDMIMLRRQICAGSILGAKCYGNSEKGTLGQGDNATRGDSPNEIGDDLPLIDLGTDFVFSKFPAGGTIAQHCCAVSIVDETKCWGLNDMGQLGIGSYINMGDNTSEMGDNLPYINLTAIPFAEPTTDPTFQPTEIPTVTSDPTIQPTSLPTSDPTADPTNPPTSDPIVTTSRYPTEADSKSSTSQWQNSYLTPIGVVMISIVVLAILLVILGYGHMLVFGFDDFKLTAVVLFGIYSWDFFSDILFAADVWKNYLSQNASSSIPDDPYPENASTVIIWSIFSASVAFVIFPLLKNFVDLLKFQGKWQQHPLHADRYMSWLDMYGNVLFFLSFLCGSTFAAVELVNSNLFGRRVFCMGLSKLDLREFNQKRLVNVVVGENLPQLLVQILYASVIEGEIGTVSGAAIISSSLSICVAILDFVSKRKLMTVEVNQCLFSVKVTSTEKKFTENRSTFKHKTWYLSAEIARIFPVDRNAVEMLPMDKFSNHEHDGLIVHFLISTSRFTGKQMMDKLQENHLGHLARQIARAWELDLETMDLYDLVDTNYHLGDTAASVQVAMTRFNGRTDTQNALQLFDDEDRPKETSDIIAGTGTEIVYDEEGQEGRHHSNLQEMQKKSL